MTPHPSSRPRRYDTGLSLQDVDPERPALLETPWGPFALFRIADELVCVEAFCPHMHGPLFAGTVADGAVTCPWHLWRYDLRTGARIDSAAPPAGPDARPLERCAVELGPRSTLVLVREAKT